MGFFKIFIVLEVENKHLLCIIESSYRYKSKNGLKRH